MEHKQQQQQQQPGTTGAKSCSQAAEVHLAEAVAAEPPQLDDQSQLQPHGEKLKRSPASEEYPDTGVVRGDELAAVAGGRLGGPCRLGGLLSAWTGVWRWLLAATGCGVGEEGLHSGGGRGVMPRQGRGA